MGSINDVVHPTASSSSYDEAKRVLMASYTTEGVANLVDPPNFNAGLALLAAGAGFEVGDALLLELGDFLLLESGDKILIDF